MGIHPQGRAQRPNEHLQHTLSPQDWELITEEGLGRWQEPEAGQDGANPCVLDLTGLVLMNSQQLWIFHKTY